jgi:hypothetical protein
MSKTMNRARLAAFLSVLGLFASFARAVEYVRVAYDDAGAAEQQPHLKSGNDWRFTVPDNSEESLLTAAFSDCVEFGYAGLNPKATYKVKLRFFSDCPREERVKAGGVTVLNSVVLETGVVAEREIQIPAEAYANGKLTLSIEKLSGPNAVVSEIEVLSTDPAQLGAIPLPETPLPVLTPRPIDAPMELGGTWQFSAAAPDGFEKAVAHDDWTKIQVPGEWVMQGFTVKPDTPAAYFRTFQLSAKPAGKRFKLRFAAVYSLCRVWLNGVEVGGHEGGFVPFEFDVTDALKIGQNTLALTVQSESPLDKLSCGSQYACHALGGISRKVQLFSVPDVHLSDLKIETTFDANYHDATLTAKLAIRNQSSRVSSCSATLTIVPLDKDSTAKTPPMSIKWSDVAPGETWNAAPTMTVKNPAKWDNEHPHLYKMIVKIDSSDAAEMVEEKFGFRQIEVRGNQVFVNNTPIKIHGVCRHEVHPLLGRALNAEWWKKDAEIFREGNCNFIRTSHYPPAEEFLEECDRLGLFVELEAPLCWVGHGASDFFKGVPADELIFQRLAQANLETVQGYRNHPSVIMRSMANESSWSKLFARVHQAVRKADPTRPGTFHDQCWDNYNNNGSKEMPIAVIHYPGLTGPERCAKESRPVHLGEYCHLESYNRRELATDPGVRDAWGPGLGAMWEKMRSAPGCFGGAIWSGLDDVFCLPSGETVGYGTWGPIDGWRGQKPEYWHMKKVYSPLRMTATSVPVPASGQPVRLEVENRHDFTDLSEIRFEWKLGEKSGKATAAALPGGKGILEIPFDGENSAGKLVEVRAVSPRGFTEDIWQVALGADPRIVPPVPNATSGKVKLEKTSDNYIIHSGNYTLTVNKKTGMFQAADEKGHPALSSGPALMLLAGNADMCGSGLQMFGMEKEIEPFTDTCHDWKADAVTAEETADGVKIHIEGSYAEAKGSFTLSCGHDGKVSLHYSFIATERGKCDPRQIGVVFDLPHECQSLSWRRKAFWSSYPDDHIGRPAGTATAFERDLPFVGWAGPRVEPKWNWNRDQSKNGTNDFRSTKMNIFEASLLSSSGNGLRVLSDGTQHVRSWVEGDRTRFLVADYANEGSPPFFCEFVTPRHPLDAGASVEGTVRLEIR